MPITTEGKQFFIYALICPLTLDVKYVGQTVNLDQRTGGKHHTTGKHNSPLAQWLRTLGHLSPHRVILERGTNRRVELRRHGRRSQRWHNGVQRVWLSSCLEAKWIKRFRRTILNQNKDGVMDASRLLVNPPLPWEE